MAQAGTITARGARHADAAAKAMFPCRVRQWELVKFAGAGSLARIYRARPVGAPDDQPASYAIKMLRPEWQDKPEAIRLLQREALAGRSVSHPHLVPILATAVTEPPRMLVMPWLSGASLRERLAAAQQFDGDRPDSCVSTDEPVPFDRVVPKLRRAPFDVPTALWIVRQTAEALDALHTAGWTHGDVSPGNIHISPSGHATLMDLSFAQRPGEEGSAVDRPVMGTCRYLAPEHLTSRLAADIRSDIYSLGAVMFEMLTGRPPYLAKDLAELAFEHRQSSVPDMATLAPEVPREVAYLVRQMLAKVPLRRPQTPRELIDRLVRLEIGAFSTRA
ncbi:MAG: serine/threonine protein kinase [Planctomycetaceae bacterium]|nr:serine/threonine protein kinase [Planctomycetaceae bacterium]